MLIFLVQIMVEFAPIEILFELVVVVLLILVNIRKEHLRFLIQLSGDLILCVGIQLAFVDHGLNFFFDLGGYPLLLIMPIKYARLVLLTDVGALLTKGCWVVNAEEKVAEV